ncbi:MAG: hypothetical protein U0325_34770 [Polyangiales bacterium]
MTGPAAARPLLHRIYRGSARGTVVGAPSQVIVQPTGAQTFAYDLAAAGDVGGDGYEDMLVGAGRTPR